MRGAGESEGERLYILSYLIAINCVVLLTTSSTTVSSSIRVRARVGEECVLAKGVIFFSKSRYNRQS